MGKTGLLLTRECMLITWNMVAEICPQFQTENWALEHTQAFSKI